MKIFVRDGNESGIRTWKDEHTRMFYFGATKLPYVKADKYMLTIHLFRYAVQFVLWKNF